ncbi:MAG: molybdenum cofactor guanylyltransferase [Gammaproteobacteria bacterium]|nr:molybdenum cofactor guanylyltransferase [Gammaproteobacteria bacterium]MDH5800411.1 molybdenum cofactor guanylyltransferase [Gammaproteobacteria bacterium]
MTALIHIEHLLKTRSRHRLLDITGFKIPENTCMVLSGRNGAGKTTLLKILAGLEAPDQAMFHYHGVSQDWHSLRPTLLRHTVYLHQHPYMFDRSVWENVAYGLRFTALNKTQIDEQVQQALNWAGLSHLAQRNAQSLSGGEKQRVALSRARILAPKLLLLDEPMANMDRESREQTIQLIKRLEAEGISSIVTSHEPHFARQFSQTHRHLCKTGPQRYTIVEPFLYTGPLNPSAAPEEKTIVETTAEMRRWFAVDPAKPAYTDKTEMTTVNLTKQKVTAVILAGGRARRMGGQDKGLIPLRGTAMIEYVLNSVQPQVKTLLINANRNLEQYGQYGYEVVEDIIGDYYGPLVGMASGLQASKTDLVVTLPCDSPLLPEDLVSKLVNTLEHNEAEIAVAHDGNRMQPVFACLRRSLLPDLLQYLEAGGRKIDTWYAQKNTVLADFSKATQVFININTEEDQCDMEALLEQRESHA